MTMTAAFNKQILTLSLTVWHEVVDSTSTLENFMGNAPTPSGRRKQIESGGPAPENFFGSYFSFGPILTS